MRATRQGVQGRGAGGPGRAWGFTLIEVLIGITILVVGILGVATMFGTGYSNVGQGAQLTMAVTAARQMLEDVRTIPFDNLLDLNGPGGAGFDTSLLGTQPAADPARNIARKWRYAFAGEVAGSGWNFTAAERAAWQSLGVGSVPFGASGLLVVTSPSATLRQIAITVRVPGRGRAVGNTVQLTTLLSRL